MNEKRQSTEASRAAVISEQVSTGAWVARSMTWPTLGSGQVVISGSRHEAPHCALCSVLSVESACSFSLPLPLHRPPALCARMLSNK